MVFPKDYIRYQSEGEILGYASNKMDRGLCKNIGNFKEVGQIVTPSGKLYSV